MKRNTEKYLKIVKLLKQGRKLSEIAKLTQSSYIYVWKIAKEQK